ncbi:hypothetical protein EJB05_24901, partial [Eragrostis curvula]
MRMISERTEGHISSQAIQNRSPEKKIAMEQEQSITLSDKKKCFACDEISHSLDQCRIKHNLVYVAQPYGHATRFRFYMINPSEKAVEKGKFYRHCLLITSNIILDPTKVKDELQKSWKLSSAWELRRECMEKFLASFNSEDDLISSLKHPMMETYLDDKEVTFTVTRSAEGDAESIDLNGQWFLVCGVPKINRNWKELYQVASAVGVLIGVDEESLEVEDKEPIRMKIASRNLDDTLFSHHFVFGWSCYTCRMVTFTIEGKDINQQKKELEERIGKANLDAFNRKSEEKRNKVIEMHTGTLNKGTTSENSSNTMTVDSTGNRVLDSGDCSDKEHRKEQVNFETGVLLEGPEYTEESTFDGEIEEIKISAPATITMNSKKTTVDSPKTEGVQSISSASMTEVQYRGIPKPPIRHVFTRRGKKQQVSEASNKNPSNKQDKGMGPESSNCATGIGASTAFNILDYKNCSQLEHKKELNMDEAARLESKKKQTSEDSSKTESTQFTRGCTKGTDAESFGMDGMAPGVQFHEKQHASKMLTRLAQNSEEFTTDGDIYDSFSKMGLHENLLKGIYQYGLEKPSVVHQRGIVPLCKGLDVIQQSLSGTTVTVCCGILQRLDFGSADCQALYLGVKAHACTGGTRVHAEQQILSSSAHVLIGTPGRVLDVLQRRAICPEHIRMFVLDEAGELFTGGSKDQIDNIIQRLSTKVQVGIFSATFSRKALEISHTFMNKSATIMVPRDEELKGIHIDQFHVKVEKEELKLGKLCDLFDMMVGTQSIIFVSPQHKVKSLIEQIRGKGITVSASHGSMNQQARDNSIQEFRSGLSGILIATDLRGTDVMQVPIVINYDLPAEPVTVSYIRRALLCGQSQRKGVVINFITRADELDLFGIERFCNSQIGKLPSNIADRLI